MKTEDNENYEAHCWPGQSSWPDYTRNEVRELWAQQFLLENYRDTSEDVFIWNDMNEPAVFGGPENTMPKTNLHMEGVEHRDIHNLYGMFMQRATSEGLMLRNQEQRPFVLSRAFYAGTQRYGAIWTGDNTAKWEFLEASVPMCLSVALGGISFCGSDVGGFFGEPSAELMVRWYQIGAFSPFFRSHAHIETKRREPWVFGKEALDNIRYSLQLRYRLLPYWYTLFYEYSTLGTPVIQAMFLQYPDDPSTYRLENQYHVGDALMVVSISGPAQKSVGVYMPAARWYDLHTHKEVTSTGRIEVETQERYVPAFIKGGNIVPMQERPRRSSQMMKKDPFTLVVALGEDFSANGKLFVDDGNSFGYKQGEYLEGIMEFKDDRLRYSVAHPWGAENTVEKIVILGLKKEPVHVSAESSCIHEDVGFYVNDGVVTVKLPKVKINESWTLTLIY